MLLPASSVKDSGLRHMAAKSLQLFCLCSVAQSAYESCCRLALSSDLRVNKITSIQLKELMSFTPPLSRNLTLGL